MPRLLNKPPWLAHVVASYAAYLPVLVYQLYFAPLRPTAPHLLLYALLALASPLMAPFSFMAQIFSADFLWWWGDGLWREAAFAYTYVLAFAAVYFPARRHQAKRKLALLGHCPHCHYDLRATSHSCPECGSPVHPNPDPFDAPEPPDVLFTPQPLPKTT